MEVEWVVKSGQPCVRRTVWRKMFHVELSNWAVE
jgi:hypothetical protein